MTTDRSGFSWLLLWLCAASAWGAEVIPPVPKDHFNDYATVVSTATAMELNRTLEDFEKQTSSQIVVAIFPKMQSGSSLEDYTQRVAESWGVGKKRTNNGAVLFVFVRDRRLRLEVGYGLEGAVPDAIAKRIIDDEITPHFRRGAYDSGLRAGVAAILQAARGEYRGSGRTARQQSDGASRSWIWVLVLLLFISVFFVKSRGGTVYRRSGRRRYWSPGVWPVGGWGGGSSGGGGGGFSGGSFSSGGGSFGGGGASGSW